MRITAAVTEEKGAPFALQELELGELRQDEVLVEVAAAGICHTDLICRDQWYPVPFPSVFGHEGAGVVARVGDAVTGLGPGDRVGDVVPLVRGLPELPRRTALVLLLVLRAQLRLDAAR